MSSKISFEGIGEVVATFACGEGVSAGQVVKVTEDGTVGACSASEKFCGVALSAENGYAAVQLGGLVKVPTSGGSITAGWCKLSADGSGGVKKDDSAGVEYLVVRVETDAAVICL
ncbi:MAG: hypothetical protein MSB10_11240 [Clostridiales bacterium]|uniref:hypothetical protein n=1 Tax=Flavonifractor porci TaxID=3133422 RepID=UPI003094E8A3|nr:hypothetical protein [Clostridiales bacterium]